MMQLGVAIALLLAIGLPVVRADDGEECMGDVVYCFMVVIYAMAMGTFSSFMRSPPVQSPPPRIARSQSFSCFPSSTQASRSWSGRYERPSSFASSGGQGSRRPCTPTSCRCDRPAAVIANSIAAFVYYCCSPFPSLPKQNHDEYVRATVAYSDSSCCSSISSTCSATFYRGCVRRRCSSSASCPSPCV